jgi:phospholipid N-methyltransferase
LPQADYIVSGLPFSTLPKELDDAIMAATARAIRPGGQFLVYQYSDYVLPLLRRHFYSVTDRRSWLCIPPAKLFWATTTSVAALPAEV